MHTAKIGIASAASKLVLTATPSSTVTTTASGTSSFVFTPSPINEALIDTTTASFSTVTNPTASTPIGGIVYQQPVVIEVGTQTNSLIPQLLNAYQYKFENFTLDSPSDFALGDVVYFNHTGLGNYACTLEKAKVNDLAKGAYNNLFVFISYTENILKVMHKGYLAIPNSAISSWQTGRTIYLDSSNKLSITPTLDSGSWVRSIGFCIPNTENKKIIWFEPDTTYLKIR
tara:strand:+ start:2614 stop:3300 length:687 start_codon:yes stop_codon:yes gene_type:complete